MPWLTWCLCPLHHGTTFPWWPFCRAVPQTWPCDGLTLLVGLWEQLIAAQKLGPAPSALAAVLELCSQCVPRLLTLSSPAVPGQPHRKAAAKPGIKPLPERPPISPALALITRLHFCYTRFLLFWYFQWDTLQFPVDFEHGKQTTLLFVSFRYMWTLSDTNSCSLVFERNQNSEVCKVFFRMLLMLL